MPQAEQGPVSAQEAGPQAVGFHSPALLRVVALGLGGRGAEALAFAESLPPSSLPPHALPWRAWLIERLRSASGGARARPPLPKP